MEGGRKQRRGSLERARAGSASSSGGAGGVALGTRVVVRKTEKNPERVGQEAEIIVTPTPPNTWYKVRFDDGAEIRVRMSGFRVLAPPRAQAGAAPAAGSDAGPDARNHRGPPPDVDSDPGADGPHADDADSRDDDMEDAAAARAGPRLNMRTSSSSSSGSTFTVDKAVLVVGKRVRIRETSNVRHRVAHLIGKTGTIRDVPQHPNTWYKVDMDSGDSLIKFQATALLPLDGGDASPAPASNRRARPDARLVPTDVLLSDTDPNQWVGEPVIIKCGLMAEESATVLRSGNGWVQLRIHGPGQELARRAYELLVPEGSKLLDENGRPNIDSSAASQGDDDASSHQSDGDGDGDEDDNHEMDLPEDDFTLSQAGGDSDVDSKATGVHSSVTRKRLRRALSRNGTMADDADATSDAGEAKAVGRSGSAAAKAEDLDDANDDTGDVDDDDDGEDDEDDDADEEQSEAAGRGKRTRRLTRRRTGDDDASDTQSLQGSVATSASRRKRKGRGVSSFAASSLAGYQIVVTNGVHRGMVGTITSGNGYFYIDTVESQRVRKKREQFQILEPIEALFALANKKCSKNDIERWRAVKVGNRQATLMRYSASYLAYSWNGDSQLHAAPFRDIEFTNKVPDRFRQKLQQCAASLRHEEKAMESANAASAMGDRLVSLASDARAHRKRESSTNGTEEDTEARATPPPQRPPESEKRRSQRAQRRAASKPSKPPARSIRQQRIPLTEDPDVNRLLQANKDRQDIVVNWMHHDREKFSKYNQHRPNLKLWLDRICGDDEEEDAYVPPVVKMYACSVCKLEKHSKTSSCWNPACWKSPVYQPGAAPLNETTFALPLPQGRGSSYVFAVAQSPRKPGYIEVPEAAFPYMFNVDKPRESALGVDEAKPDTPAVKVKEEAAANAVEADGQTSDKDAGEMEQDQKDQLAPEVAAPSPSSARSSLPFSWSATLADEAEMKGWGRFVAGRKRVEEEMITSPLETYQYRATPHTLGRRKRPLDEPRDHGLNGYFGKGWNKDLARPFYERRKRRKAGRGSQKDRDSSSDEGSDDADGNDNKLDESDSCDSEDEYDIIGLDFRWRSWEDTRAAEEPVHPTTDAAAALMSIVVEGIDASQLKTLTQEKDQVLKEVNAKLAKELEISRSQAAKAEALLRANNASGVFIPPQTNQIKRSNSGSTSSKKGRSKQAAQQQPHQQQQHFQLQQLQQLQQQQQQPQQVMRQQMQSSPFLSGQQFGLGPGMLPFQQQFQATQQAFTPQNQQQSASLPPQALSQASQQTGASAKRGKSKSKKKREPNAAGAAASNGSATNTPSQQQQQQQSQQSQQQQPLQSQGPQQQQQPLQSGAGGQAGSAAHQSPQQQAQQSQQQLHNQNSLHPFAFSGLGNNNGMLWGGQSLQQQLAANPFGLGLGSPALQGSFDIASLIQNPISVNSFLEQFRQQTQQQQQQQQQQPQYQSTQAQQSSPQQTPQQPQHRNQGSSQGNAQNTPGAAQLSNLSIEELIRLTQQHQQHQQLYAQMQQMLMPQHHPQSQQPQQSGKPKKR